MYKRQALQQATISFRLDELGIGHKDGGTHNHQKNRFKLIERIFNLGDPKPPEMEAEWKTWLHRLDIRGRKEYRWSWATRLKTDMVEVLEDMEGGRRDAALRWHRRKTFEWTLNAAAVKVPGRLSASEGAAPAAT